MFGAQRRERLLEALQRDGGATVGTLSDSLQVSEATIRRDLTALARQGMLRRTHGGAMPSDSTTMPELSVQEKAILHIEEKWRIGAAAAAMIENGDTVALSGGTTALHVALSIRENQHATVVTNAVNVVWELARRPNITVVCAGGRLRPNTLELVGPLTEQTLHEVFVDKAFIGINGLSYDEGLTTHEEMEAVISRIMIRSARRVIVIADHSKLNRVAFARMGEITQMHALITDTAADPDVLNALRRVGIEVIAV